jgi:hypothetical protein
LSKKIVLVGAPGSGKSEVAQELSKLLEYRGSVSVVDDYVGRLEAATDTRMGEFATYIGNMSVAMARWGEERAVEKSDIQIVCGSVIETSVYISINAYLSHAVKKKPSNSINDVRAGSALNLLSIFCLDTYKADHTFYLPLSEEVGKTDIYAKSIDDYIPEVAEALHIPLDKLDSGNTDVEMTVAEILAAIKEKENQNAPSPSQ